MSDTFFSKFDFEYFSLIIYEIFIYFAINNDFLHHNDTFRKKIKFVGHLGLSDT